MVAEIGLALTRKSVAQRYTQHVNKLSERTGSLWEGRYRSCLVPTERYVIACYRYIELNPVRAGMVSNPIDYPWSSYTTNIGARKSSWLTPHSEYLALGLEDETRHEAYRRLFDTEFDTELLSDIRKSTHGGYALGNQRFREQIEQALRRRATPRRPGRPAEHPSAG